MSAKTREKGCRSEIAAARSRIWVMDRVIFWTLSVRGSYCSTVTQSSNPETITSSCR